MSTQTTTDRWRVETMTGGSGNITHRYIAVAPGCPAERHPTRDCLCAVHRTASDAWAYVAEKDPDDRTARVHSAFGSSTALALGVADAASRLEPDVAVEATRDVLDMLGLGGAA